jgi:hypothetical protein
LLRARRLLRILLRPKIHVRLRHVVHAIQPLGAHRFLADVADRNAAQRPLRAFRRRRASQRYRDRGKTNDAPEASGKTGGVGASTHGGSRQTTGERGNCESDAGEAASDDQFVFSAALIT